MEIKLRIPKELEKDFHRKSVMEILDVDRRENNHSCFLGWLFDNEITSQTAIWNLINILREENPDYEPHDINDVKVKQEEPVEWNSCFGRADIVIEYIAKEKKHRIVIENKVYSSEHEIKPRNGGAIQSQTQLYWNYYSQKEGDLLCVFLTCPKQLSDKIKGPKDNNFVWIDYQNILDGVLKPCLVHLKESPKKSGREKAQQLINDYINCLGIGVNQEGLMAIDCQSPFAKRIIKLWSDNAVFFNALLDANPLALNVWQQYKDIIRPSFKVLDYMVKRFTDLKLDKKAISDINKIVNGKDTTHYSINGESPIRKNKLIYELVSRYISDNNIRKDGIAEPTLAILQDIRHFHFSLKGKSDALTNMVVISEEFYKKKKTENIKGNNEIDISKDDDWEALPFNGQTIYVLQTGWDGTALMNKVIEHVKTFMNVEIKEVIQRKK